MNWLALALAVAGGSVVFTIVVVSCMTTRWYWNG